MDRGNEKTGKDKGRGRIGERGRNGEGKGEEGEGKGKERGRQGGKPPTAVAGANRQQPDTSVRGQTANSCSGGKPPTAILSRGQTANSLLMRCQQQ